MSAQRKLIRQAFAEHLKNKTPAGKNVFPSRSEPLWDQIELPAICIYAGRENITIQDESPRKYRRELEIRVEIGVTGSDADDQLDDIGDAVERMIGRSDRLLYAKEHVVADIILTSEQIDFRDEGRKIIGSLLIIYTATYFTYEPDECDSEPVDDFKRVHTDYDLSGQQQPADSASDDVELSE
jgi:hypothetical protein